MRDQFIYSKGTRSTALDRRYQEMGGRITRYQHRATGRPAPGQAASDIALTRKWMDSIASMSPASSPPHAGLGPQSVIEVEVAVRAAPITVG